VTEPHHSGQRSEQTTSLQSIPFNQPEDTTAAELSGAVTKEEIGMQDNMYSAYGDFNPHQLLKQNEELDTALKQQQCMMCHGYKNQDMVSRQEYNHVVYLYQKTQQENEELKLKLEEKGDEIKRIYTSLLHVLHDSEKRSVQYSHDHEAIQSEFRSYCDHMEFEIPKILQFRDSSKKQIFLKNCCKLYQTSFDICRKEIYKMFDKTLTSIVQLSEEEEQGEVNFDRRKKLKDATTAYQYLLKQCEFQLSRVDITSLVTKLAKVYLNVHMQILCMLILCLCFYYSL
jgi:BMFP domain-containing protein YqiC